MRFGRQFAVLVVALGLLPGLGCKKKNQPVTAKMQAPTLAVQVPDQIPEIAPPPEPQPAKEETTVEEPPPKKTPAKHHSSKKPATAAASQPAGNTTVAANRAPVNPVEAVTDTAIAADVSSQTLTRQKETTAQLLDSAEKNLKGLKDLNHDEESMVTQARSYIAQSRSATKEGDFERAYNLAQKAHLLADALVKK